MKKSLFLEEVLLSWRRCMENRLPMDAAPERIDDSHEKFAELLNKHTHLISVYDKVINRIKAHMDKEFLFLYYQTPST